MRMPGRGPDAERAFEAAIRLKPDYAVAENDLGIVLAQTGRPRAVAAFAAAVRLDPTLVAAENNLRMARQFLERGPGQGRRAGEGVGFRISRSPRDAPFRRRRR